MGVESYLVLWVFTDECCHPNRFRVELMLIESFEIGRLDFPNRDALESTLCLLPNDKRGHAGPMAPDTVALSLLVSRRRAKTKSRGVGILWKRAVDEDGAFI